jgi:hypothetical protein
MTDKEKLIQGLQMIARGRVNFADDVADLLMPDAKSAQEAIMQPPKEDTSIVSKAKAK